MEPVYSSCTWSISVACDWRAAYAFISDPANLPRWATTFCLSAKVSGKDWILETPQGSLGLRLTPGNEFGVVDHVVIPGSGEEVYVPMRVVPNGQGCEILFTLFRRAGEEQFEADKKLVGMDLNKLKEVLETKGFSTGNIFCK